LRHGAVCWFESRSAISTRRPAHLPPEYRKNTLPRHGPCKLRGMRLQRRRECREGGVRGAEHAGRPSPEIPRPGSGHLEYSSEHTLSQGVEVSAFTGVHQRPIIMKCRFPPRTLRDYYWPPMNTDERRFRTCPKLDCPVVSWTLHQCCDCHRNRRRGAQHLMGSKVPPLSITPAPYFPPSPAAAARIHPSRRPTNSARRTRAVAFSRNAARSSSGIASACSILAVQLVRLERNPRAAPPLLRSPACCGRGPAPRGPWLQSAPDAFRPPRWRGYTQSSANPTHGSLRRKSLRE